MTCSVVSRCLPSKYVCEQDQRPLHSCPSDYEEREFQRKTHARLQQEELRSASCDHASSSAIKFEETVLCECHSGYILDGTPDGNKKLHDEEELARNGRFKQAKARVVKLNVLNQSLASLGCLMGNPASSSKRVHHGQKKRAATNTMCSGRGFVLSTS